MKDALGAINLLNLEIHWPKLGYPLAQVGFNIAPIKYIRAPAMAAHGRILRSRFVRSFLPNFDLLQSAFYVGGVC
jgi:hypothetical protein